MRNQWSLLPVPYKGMDQRKLATYKEGAQGADNVYMPAGEMLVRPGSTKRVTLTHTVDYAYNSEEGLHESEGKLYADDNLLLDYAPRYSLETTTPIASSYGGIQAADRNEQWIVWVDTETYKLYGWDGTTLHVDDTYTYDRSQVVVVGDYAFVNVNNGSGHYLARVYLPTWSVSLLDFQPYGAWWVTQADDGDHYVWGMRLRGSVYADCVSYTTTSMTGTLIWYGHQNYDQMYLLQMGYDLYLFGGTSTSLYGSRITTSGSVIVNEAYLNGVAAYNISGAVYDGYIYLQYSGPYGTRVWEIDETVTVKRSSRLYWYEAASRLLIRNGELYSLVRYDEYLVMHQLAGDLTPSACDDGSGLQWTMCPLTPSNRFGLLVRWTTFHAFDAQEEGDIEPPGSPTPVPVSRWGTYLARANHGALVGDLDAVSLELVTPNTKDNIARETNAVVSLHFAEHAIGAHRKVGDVYLGGLPLYYDGVKAREWYFEHPPYLLVEPYEETNPPLFPEGSYYMVATYVWVDAKGHVHESAPSTPVRVEVPWSAGAYFDYTVINYTATLRQDRKEVYIRLYATKADGTLYYLIREEPNFTVAPTTTGTLSSTQPDAPASLDDLETVLYTSTGELANDTLPATLAASMINGRMWAISQDNQSHIWISKAPAYSKAPPSHTLLNIAMLPCKAYQIVGVSYHPILGTDDGLYTIPGQPPNNTGHGATLADPVKVSTYKATTRNWEAQINKGGYLMTDHGMVFVDTGLAVHAIGNRIEELTDVHPCNGSWVLTEHSVAMWYQLDRWYVHAYETDTWSRWYTYNTPVGTAGPGYAVSDGFAIWDDQPTDVGDGIDFAYISGRITDPLTQLRVKSVFFYWDDYYNFASIECGAARDGKAEVAPAPANPWDIYSHARCRKHLSIQRCSYVQAVIDGRTNGSTPAMVRMPRMAVQMRNDNLHRLVKEDSNV